MSTQFLDLGGTVKAKGDKKFQIYFSTENTHAIKG
jgi:hypothetical protein